MKKSNNMYVVHCPPCGESTLKGGKGVVKGKTLLDNPPSALCATSPTQGGKLTTRGFTLIELLVVVLIIGILAAVAVPQYQKAVERSRAAEAVTLLSAFAKAYRAYYLANSAYATKFDQLDVEIPPKGNTKFLSNATDTKSNKDWSFQIENISGYVTLFAARIDGKYKGAGFLISFDGPSHSSVPILSCFERKKGANMLFDTSLAKGAYCEKVIQGTFLQEGEWSRNYLIP